MNARNLKMVNWYLPLIVEAPSDAKRASAYSTKMIDDPETHYTHLNHSTVFWFEFATLNDITDYLRHTKREFRLTGGNQHVYYARKAIAKFLTNVIGR